MMLQVISKKFFKSNNYHKTEVKTIIYSNVNLFHKIETEIAVLTNIETYNGITTYLLTFENVLEYQKDPKFQLVSVGEGEIIADLLACFSFYFNGVFSSDKNFIDNLIRSERQNVCDKSVPQKLLPEIFKRNIYITEDKSSDFNGFIKNLIGLPNEQYMKVIGSIKQLKDSIITINYNLELAYTMMVAAVESLSTSVDGYETKWEDCLTQNNRRKRLTSVLENFKIDDSDEIKKIIIEDTHAKLGMRYRMFILKYISNKYYEETVGENILKCKESQLVKAINNSYQLRSSYIHALERLPNLIEHSGEAEVYNQDNNLFFTFNGLARITIFVIKEFIYAQQKVEKEDINYMNKLPETINVMMASEYWIDNQEGYSIESSMKYYQGLLEFVSKGEYKENGFIRLNEVCNKIERLIKGENNKNKKIPLVSFYFIYNNLVIEECKCKNEAKFCEKHEDILEVPCIENAMIYIVFGAKFPWNIDILNDIYNKYDSSRYQKNTIRIPNKLEVCYMLECANIAFHEGRDDILEKFIIKAFKESAGDKYIQEIYYNFKNNNKYDVIKWHEQFI
ncbi:MAG: hypothetical protein RSF67_01700 [Clostridia bacterium]